jgi:hypothetical protein
MISFEQIPLVIDDDVPFVFHRDPDQRSFLEFDGRRLRRGGDRVCVELPIPGGWVNTTLFQDGEHVYLIASLGPTIEAYRAASQVRGIDALSVRERMAAPTLVSVLLKGKVEISGADWKTSLSVGPIGEASAVILGFAGSLERDVEQYVNLSMYPARVALAILSEVAVLRGMAHKPSTLHSGGERTEFDEIADALATGLDFLTRIVEASKR